MANITEWTYVWIALFIVDLLVNLVAEWKIQRDPSAKNLKLRYISKPFLMLLLVGMYISGSNQPMLLPIFGLIFGCIGDTFLMFDKISKWFICGTIAFFCGHICYIAYYATTFGDLATFPWWRVFFFIPTAMVFVVYALPRINGKMPGLENPISTIYGGMLLLMSLLTLFRFPELSFTDARVWIPWLGSFLFVASDGVLSVDRYHGKIQDSMQFIMATYAIGQALIAFGLMLM